MDPVLDVCVREPSPDLDHVLGEHLDVGHLERATSRARSRAVVDNSVVVVAIVIVIVI